MTPSVKEPFSPILREILVVAADCPIAAKDWSGKSIKCLVKGGYLYVFWRDGEKMYEISEIGRIEAQRIKAVYGKWNNLQGGR